MTKRVEDLVGTLCGAAEHPLAPVLRDWCHDSRPFLAFAEAHAAKIRKKVRLAVPPDERADLLAELAVAALLLRDRRFAVSYEPHHASGGRAPDFQVTFKTHTAFHIEVTRPRFLDSPEADLAGAVPKLARVICDKLGQCPPGGMNLLAVVVPPGADWSTLVPTAIRLLDASPQPSPELRPEDASAYHRGRQRLSAVALCSFTPAGQPLDVKLWLNPAAKHPLSPEITKFLRPPP